MPAAFGIHPSATDRRRQSGRIEQSGPQFGSDAADRLDGFINARHREDLFVERLRFFGNRPASQVNCSFSWSRIVRVRRGLRARCDALPFAHRLQMDGQRASCSCDCREVLFRAPALGPFLRLTQGAADGGHEARKTVFEHVIGAPF